MELALTLETVRGWETLLYVGCDKLRCAANDVAEGADQRRDFQGRFLVRRIKDVHIIAAPKDSVAETLARARRRQGLRPPPVLRIEQACDLAEARISSELLDRRRQPPSPIGVLI